MKKLLLPIFIASMFCANKLFASGDLRINQGAGGGNIDILISTNPIQSISDIPAGSNRYIQNQSASVQSASFTVLTGTVTGTFYPVSIQFPDGTVQTSSAVTPAIGPDGLAHITVYTPFGLVTSTLTLSLLAGCSDYANEGKLTADAAGRVYCADDTAGAGGGGSALEVFSQVDGVSSTPTASIRTLGGLQLSVSGSTAIVNVNFSSVASQSDLASYFLAASSQTLLSTTSAASTYLTQSSATATYLNKLSPYLSSANVTSALTVTANGTAGATPTFGVSFSSVVSQSDLAGYLPVTAKISPSTGIIAGALPNTVLVSSLTAVVTPGSYGSATVSPTIIWNAQGQIIGASSNTISSGGTDIYNATATAGFPYGVDFSTWSLTQTNGTIGDPSVTEMFTTPNASFVNQTGVILHSKLPNTSVASFLDIGASTFSYSDNVNGGAKLLLYSNNSGGSVIQMLIDGTQLFYGDATQEQHFSPIRQYDANHSNYIATKASDTISSDFTVIQPAAPGTVGQVRKIVNVDGSNIYEEYADDATGAGGGSSTLAVGTGTLTNFTNNVTSPTAAISFQGTRFKSLATGTTNIISLSSSVAVTDAAQTFAFTQTYSKGINTTTMTTTGDIIVNGDIRARGSTGLFLGLSDEANLSYATNSFKEVQVSTTLAVAGTTGSGGILKLRNAANNGYVGFKSSDSIVSDVLWTLPNADGSDGQAMVTNGAGNLSFATISGGSGSTIYNATTTAGFPFGFSASTGIFTSSIAVSGAILSSNTLGGAYSLALYPQKNYPINDQGAGAIYLDNTLNNGIGLNIYSNQASAGGLGNLLRIHADNTSFTQPLVYLIQDGTSGGAANMRMDGPAPQIELVENDQVAPAGKYEWGVNGDIYYLAGRNAADNSFNSDINYARRDASGGGYLAILSTQTPFRFGDADNSNYVSLRSPDAVASNVNLILPSADASTANEWMASDGAGALSFSHTLVNGTNPTVSAVGQFAVDTSSGQLVVHDGSNTVVWSATSTKSMTIETPAVGDFPFFWRPHADITVTSLVCVSSAATSATISVQECDANGANCAAINTAGDCTTTNTALAITDSAVTAGNRLRIQVTAVSGTPGWTAVDMYYRETRK